MSVGNENAEIVNVSLNEVEEITMQKLPKTPPDYYKNMERAGDLPTCIICGRGIKAEDPKMVHVHDGGAAVVTNDEVTQLDAAADLGLYPIGPECLRKYPEIKPYAQ